jgi:steroid delta-isomerase-like uncharacterized protein
MASEENVTIARRFFAEQDRRKGPLAPEICAPGYTVHVPGFPLMDLAGHTEFAKAFYAAFPDLKHTIEEAFATEEKAAVRFTITGTHQGELMGIPASGKPIEISGIAIFHIVGGKVEQLYPNFDQIGMMQQIGAIPSA